MQVDVNGPNTAPVYQYLKSNAGGFLGDLIKWNFEKFLVDKNGKVVERYPPTTSPLQIEVKFLLQYFLDKQISYICIYFSRMLFIVSYVHSDSWHLYRGLKFGSKVSSPKFIHMQVMPIIFWGQQTTYICAKCVSFAKDRFGKPLSFCFKRHTPVHPL